MKSHYIGIISTIALLFFMVMGVYISLAPSIPYKVGDCLVLRDKDSSIYKILEVGKYGLKVVKPYYDSYEEVFLDPNDLRIATKMDCFNLFDKKGDIK